MIDLHGIIARLSRHSIPTPAPASSRASGQAGGGDLLPVSVGRPVAAMSAASPAANAESGKRGGGPHTEIPPVANFSDTVPPHHAAGGEPTPYWPAQEEKTAFLRDLIDGRTPR